MITATVDKWQYQPFVCLVFIGVTATVDIGQWYCVLWSLLWLEQH